MRPLLVIALFVAVFLGYCTATNIPILSRYLDRRQFIKNLYADNVSAVQEMLEKNPGLVKVKTNGKYPLHIAAKYSQHTNMIRILLKYGADINQPASYSRTPLHLAVARGDEASDIIRLFLRRGAKVNQRDSFGGSPFMLICGKTRDVTLIREFRTRGASIAILDSVDQKSPLHYAARSGSVEVFKELSTVQNSVNVRDSWGAVPFHSAAQFENLPMLKWMIETYPAIKNVRDKWGRTAVHYAAMQLKSDSMRFLIEEHGMRADQPDSKGRTPLYWAYPTNENPMTNEERAALQFIKVKSTGVLRSRA